MNDGAQALFYFDLFDDYEECARRETYYGLFRAADHLYTPRKRYFATRQLYHFVRPGARRIAATVDSAALTVSSFLDPGFGLRDRCRREAGRTQSRCARPLRAAESRRGISTSRLAT